MSAENKPQLQTQAQLEEMSVRQLLPSEKLLEELASGRVPAMSPEAAVRQAQRVLKEELRELRRRLPLYRLGTLPPGGFPSEKVSGLR